MTVRTNSNSPGRGTPGVGNAGGTPTTRAQAIALLGGTASDWLTALLVAYPAMLVKDLVALKHAAAIAAVTPATNQFIYLFAANGSNVETFATRDEFLVGGPTTNAATLAAAAVDPAGPGVPKYVQLCDVVAAEAVVLGYGP